MSDNTTIPSKMVSQSKPVRVLGAVAAGALAAVGALAVIPGIPGWIPAAVGALGIILSAALAVSTEQQVTPWADVAAKATPSGQVVAGPAAAQVTGQPVAVVDIPVVPPDVPVVPPPGTTTINGSATGL